MSAGVPSSQLGISLATKSSYLQFSGATILFESGGTCGYQCWWVWGSSDTSVMGSGEHSGAFDHGLDSFSFLGLQPECHTRANQHWNVPWLSDSSHAAVVKPLIDYINFSQMFMAIMFVPCM